MSNTFIAFSVKTALIGIAAGFIIGYLSKKISKVLIVVLILLVILLELGIYDGFIQIDWLSYKPIIDEAIQNGQEMIPTLKDYALDNMPFLICLVFGFLWGFSKG